MVNLYNKMITINESVYTAVLQGIVKETKSRAGQPQLIVGGDGSGKSFLLHRLYDSVSSEETFEPIWIDGRTVFSSKDILRGKYERRCILFVDDFQYYLRRTSNSEQFLLRGALSGEKAPILIASVNAVMPQLTSYGSAFFEGFRIHYLKLLSEDEIHLFADQASLPYERIIYLLKYLPRTPRSVLFACEIIKETESDRAAIELLVQCVSPLYQYKFSNLLPQQQRIMYFLSGETDGLRLSGLRKKTGQNAGNISPYLTQMIETGLITKEAKSARDGCYRIADPLFDLWLR